MALLIDKVIPAIGRKRVERRWAVGFGIGSETYRERRCGIADSCGPYLDVCAF
jgi:hypothetical protein